MCIQQDQPDKNAPTNIFRQKQQKSRDKERERDLTNSHLKLCFTPPFSDFDPKVVFFFACSHWGVFANGIP
jgi:hypothetical protein